MLRATLLALIVFGSACERNPQPSGRQAPSGLPAQGGAAPAGENPHGGATPANPHGDMAANPHGGGTPNIPADMPMPTPPPLDPSRVLEGTIEATPELAAEIKSGDVIFLSAKPVDPKTGEVQRMPVAVDRIDVGTLPMKFTLSNQNVMVAGTEFSGTVQITARVDRDQEATTRKTGDIEGFLKVEIPAKDLKLVLDKRLP
jgi:cytochrome c-type biogenesis protein CcmH